MFSPSTSREWLTIRDEKIMPHRPARRQPLVVGVIASRGDLERAVRMRRAPDLFELRLDQLAGMANQAESAMPKLRTPLIITARDPREGGANKLPLRQRRDLLDRFFKHADYIDVELRLASTLLASLSWATNKNVRRIISFHDFKSTPKLKVLEAKAHNAKALGADIFKVATRTDTPRELGRLVDFIANSCVNLPLAVMGIGRLGAISRVLLAHAGSVLLYASMGRGSDVEGQLSLEQLRELGFGSR
jgi:3-dehydroquinate dehydratase-1